MTGLSKEELSEGRKMSKNCPVCDKHLVYDIAGISVVRCADKYIELCSSCGRRLDAKMPAIIKILKKELKKEKEGEK